MENILKDNTTDVKTKYLLELVGELRVENAKLKRQNIILKERNERLIIELIDAVDSWKQHCLSTIRNCAFTYGGKDIIKEYTKKEKIEKLIKDEVELRKGITDELS